MLPEIMVPLVSAATELAAQRTLIEDCAAEIMNRHGVQIPYKIGTMIEVPRAALLAADIAEHADFFSIGTNDLTQLTFGLSRDDAARFLPAYLEAGILKDDPFQVLDEKGVGQLVKLANRNGRSAKLGLSVGVCGEHGGRSAVDRVLPSCRARLCELLAVPGAGGAPGGCACGDGS